MRARGVNIYAAEGGARLSHFDADWTSPSALVVGAEARGKQARAGAGAGECVCVCLCGGVFGCLPLSYRHRSMDRGAPLQTQDRGSNINQPDWVVNDQKVKEAGGGSTFFVSGGDPVRLNNVLVRGTNLVPLT